MIRGATSSIGLLSWTLSPKSLRCVALTRICCRTSTVPGISFTFAFAFA